MDDSIDIIRQALDWYGHGNKVALGTVINTWGSAPRRAGSMICINGAGEFQGSVSGGCVEGAVIHQALETIKSGEPRMMEFGVSNEQAWEVGLACGGSIKVWVEAMDDELCAELGELSALDDAATPVLVAKQLEGASSTRVIPAHSIADDSILDEPGQQAALQCLRQDKPLTIETPSGQLFLQPFNPELQLYVVGAVHITQQLVPLARQAGFNVSVIDPRQAFATQARFPDVTLVQQWPNKAFSNIKLNHRSAVVTLTHDPKFDDPALMSAMDSDAFYIGALGSRKTHAGRLQRLKEQGASEDQLVRIHAPIGLDIGAANPAEIAISIIAELVQQLRKHD